MTHWFGGRKNAKSFPILSALARKYLTTYFPPALWVRERQLPRYATSGTMGSTVTAPLAAFGTAAVILGKGTRPQDVLKHQSVPKGFDMSTMIYIHCSYYS